MRLLGMALLILAGPLTQGEDGLSTQARKFRDRLLKITHDQQAFEYARYWATAEELRLDESDRKQIPALLRHLVEYLDCDMEEESPEEIGESRMLLAVTLRLAQANPSVAHTESIHLLAVRLHKDYERYSALAFDILGESPDGIRIIQEHMESEDDFLRSQAFRIALDHSGEKWADLAIKRLRSLELTTLGPRMNNLQDTAGKLMTTGKELIRQPLETRLARIIPRGLTQLYRFPHGSIQPRRDPTSNFLRSLLVKAVDEDSEKVFGAIRSAIKELDGLLEEAATALLWQLGAPLAEEEKRILRRRRIPFDVTLDLH
jgi:hypothetical protein